MLDALKSANFLSLTVIIVGAKHGQAPININQLRQISTKDAINGASPGLVAFGTGDDIYIYWLSDQTKTADAVKALEVVRTQAQLGVGSWPTATQRVVRGGFAFFEIRKTLKPHFGWERS
ncbi:MAG: hypothetical protein ACRD10_14620 [Terriglobia bacterium]